ncbi:unnamed protein product [Auanema sp. JU1783]|nr:unnamed protein product [Auanema sp. JU1783]
MNSSVTDYLTSLGVSHNSSKVRPRRRDTVDSNLNDLLYARVDDLVGAGTLDLSSNVQPYTTTPIMTSVFPAETPSYQPLNDIFHEVKRYQDESRQGRPSRREYVQIEI